MLDLGQRHQLRHRAGAEAEMPGERALHGGPLLGPERIVHHGGLDQQCRGRDLQALAAAGGRLLRVAEKRSQKVRHRKSVVGRHCVFKRVRD